MKLSFEGFLGAKPFLYGREVIRGLGVRGHYVDENDVADFVGGYSIKEINPRSYTEFNLGEIFDDSCAHLLPDHGLILLNANMPKVRKRTSVFHEIGHDVQPLHKRSAFSCKTKDIDPTAHKEIEKEAFLCGSEIMYPLKPFISDSTSLPLEIGSIRKLGERYKGSLEATSIRYAHTNQNIMAIVVVQENSPNHSHTHETPSIGQPEFPFRIPPYIRANGHPPAPLRVQYCVTAHRFRKYFRSGTEIREGNIVHQCWLTKSPIAGEIPASALGSSEKFRYFAECSPIDDDRVMVLLWLPNRQPEFFSMETIS